MLKTANISTNPFLLVKFANEGVSAENLQDLYILTNHDKKFFADILLISTKTIDRYVKENKRFNPSESEKLIKLKAIYDLGLDVFGDVENFNSWIERPAYGLGNMFPKALLTTISGIQLVEEELIRIAYGDLA